MAYGFSQHSLDRLKDVHPDLVWCAHRALELSFEHGGPDFMVVQGCRTRQECCVNYGKGRTVAECAAKGVPTSFAQPGIPKVTWLNNPFNSMHCQQKDGFGHAVDLLPAPYDWKIEDPKSTPEVDDNFAKVAKFMFMAAAEKGIHLRWGANWDGDNIFREKGETDNPHFEIPLK